MSQNQSVKCISCPETDPARFKGSNSQQCKKCDGTDAAIAAETARKEAERAERQAAAEKARQEAEEQAKTVVQLPPEGAPSESPTT